MHAVTACVATYCTVSAVQLNFSHSFSFLSLFVFLIFQATGEAAGEDVDSDSDSDDDDDDVRVTIGDIKTGAPQYTQVLVKVLHYLCGGIG